MIWFTISCKGYVISLLGGICFSFEFRMDTTLISCSLICGGTNFDFFFVGVSSFLAVKIEPFLESNFELCSVFVRDFLFLIMSVMASDSCDRASCVFLPSELGFFSSYFYSSYLAMILFFSLMSGTSFFSVIKVAWLILKLLLVIGSLGSSFESVVSSSSCSSLNLGEPRFQLC
jgi:hypothetical protein